MNDIPHEMCSRARAQGRPKKFKQSATKEPSQIHDGLQGRCIPGPGGAQHLPYTSDPHSSPALPGRILLPQGPFPSSASPCQETPEKAKTRGQSTGQDSAWIVLRARICWVGGDSSRPIQKRTSKQSAAVITKVLTQIQQCSL